MKNMEENRWRCVEAYELSRLRKEFLEKKITLSDWKSMVQQEMIVFQSSNTKEENRVLFENVFASLIAEYGDLLN
jgi:hypothetical protein